MCGGSGDRANVATEPPRHREDRFATERQKHREEKDREKQLNHRDAETPRRKRSPRRHEITKYLRGADERSARRGAAKRRFASSASEPRCLLCGLFGVFGGLFGAVADLILRFCASLAI